MQAIHQQTNTLMRQSFKTLLACLAMASLCATNAHAQLGNILKKPNKRLKP